MQQVVQGILQGGDQTHVCDEWQLVHNLGVVRYFGAVPDDRPRDGAKSKVAGLEGGGLRLEHLAQVSENLLNIQHARDRVCVIAGLEGQTLQSGVADEEAAAVDVEDDRTDLDGQHRRVGKSGIADEVGAVRAGGQKQSAVRDAEAGERVQCWNGIVSKITFPT